MATVETRVRLQQDLERTQRELGSYADYQGPWHICLFQRQPDQDETRLEALPIGNAPTRDDRAAAEAAAELRTTVLLDSQSAGEAAHAAGSILAVPLLDPLVVDPSPLQQYVFGVVTFASGLPVDVWTNRYELQMIANNYAQRLAKGIIS